jgi:hypothetical protein
VALHKTVEGRLLQPGKAGRLHGEDRRRNRLPVEERILAEEVAAAEGREFHFADATRAFGQLHAHRTFQDDEEPRVVLSFLEEGLPGRDVLDLKGVDEDLSRAAFDVVQEAVAGQAKAVLVALVPGGFARHSGGVSFEGAGKVRGRGS